MSSTPCRSTTGSAGLKRGSLRAATRRHRIAGIGAGSALAAASAQRVTFAADVWATTDYRTVFSEILLKRLHQYRMYHIFPDFEQGVYEAQETGVVSGSLHDPDFGDPEIILKHGME